MKDEAAMTPIGVAMGLAMTPVGVALTPAGVTRTPAGVCFDSG